LPARPTEKGGAEGKSRNGALTGGQCHGQLVEKGGKNAERFEERFLPAEELEEKDSTKEVT